MPVLPNADRAHIDLAKIRDYLLSRSHPRGSAKARFFESFGFSAGKPEDLEEALLKHVTDHQASDVEQTPFWRRVRGDGPSKLSGWPKSNNSRNLDCENRRGFSALGDGDSYGARLAMIKELDLVALTRSLPEHKLEAGDVGTVIMVYDDGAGYSVEFMTFSGKTIAVVTVKADAIRPIRALEIASVREVA